MSIFEKFTRESVPEFSLEALSTDDYNVHFFENDPKNEKYLQLRDGLVELGVQLIDSEQKLAQKLGIKVNMVTEYNLDDFRKDMDADQADRQLLGTHLMMVISNKDDTQARAYCRFAHTQQEGQSGLYVYWVVVDEKFRGEGYGPVLLTAVEQLAKTRQYQYLELGVMANNSPAQKLYNRQGFKAWTTTMVKAL